jgi:hypothetical protein
MSDRTSTRRLDISLPPPGSLEELDEVAGNHRRLVADRKVTATRLSGLRGQRERVAEAERAALAKAIKDGTKEPESSRVEKIDKDIEIAEERLAAVEEAIDESLADIIEVVDEHREDWTQLALETLAEAQARYAEAIEEVAKASDALLARISLLAFVRGFPEDEPSYRVRGSHVAGLRGPNGDAFWLTEIIDALRQDAAVDFTPPASPRKADPLAALTQTLFEEKRANERAGRGFLTDAQVAEGMTQELVAESL